MKKHIIALVGASIFLGSCAADDTAVGIEGEDITLNVLENDYKPEQLTAKLIDTGGLTGVTLNPNGNLFIPSINTAGEYTISYNACSKRKAKACSLGRVSVLIEPNEVHEPVSIIAGDDFFKLIPDDQTFLNVLSNDTIDSMAVVPGAYTIALEDTGGLDSVSLSNEGILSIPLDADEGEYVLTYAVCDVLDSNNCDSATVSVSLVSEAFRNDDSLSVSSNLASGYPETTFELAVLTTSTLNLENATWIASDGQNKTGENVNLQFQEPGLYSVKVSGTTSEGVNLSQDIVLSVFNFDGRLPGFTSPSLIGDINLDGLVSQEDVDLALMVSEGEVSNLDEIALLNSDFDLDDTISSFDVEQIENILASDEAYPSAIFPQEASPLSVVTIVSSELERVDNDFKVQFGFDGELLDLSVVSPGYANFAVPFEFAGAGTDGELGGQVKVYLYKNGISVDSFDLQVDPLQAPDIAPRLAMETFFTKTSDSNAQLISAVEELLLANGADQVDVNGFLALYRDAATRIEASNAQTLALLNDLSDEDANVVFQAYAANGLLNFLTETDDTAQQGGFLERASGKSLKSQASQTSENCDVVKRLCDVKRLALITKGTQRVSNYGCGVTFALLKAVKVPGGFVKDKVSKNRLNKLTNCAGIEASNSAMLLLASYYSKFDFNMTLEVLETGTTTDDLLPTFFIGGFYELEELDSLCSLTAGGGTSNVVQAFKDEAFRNYKRTSIVLNSIDFIVGDPELLEPVRESILSKAQQAINETIVELDYDNLLKRTSEAVCPSNLQIPIENDPQLDLNLSTNDSSITLSTDLDASDPEISVVCGGRSRSSFTLTAERSSCLLGSTKKDTLGPLVCPTMGP